MSAMGAVGTAVRRHRLAVLLAAVATILLSMPLWLPRAPAGPSVASHAPGGLRGFAELLRSWGAEAERLEVDPGSAVSEDSRSLVLTFPTQPSLVRDADWVEDALATGATVLIGTSGEVLAPQETVFLQELGVELTLEPSRGSLVPWRWWRQQRRGHLHRLEDDAATGSDLVSDPVDRVPLPASDCSVLARRVEPPPPPGDDPPVPVAIRCLRRGGVLLVAPTSMLTNDRIGGEGNLRFARRLAADLGDEVAFVEAGRGEPASAPGRVRSARATLNVTAVHLGFAYLLILLALARSFGPRWSRPSAPPEAHRAFFLGVGALHARLGDRRWVAEALRERWFEWDPMARGRWSDVGSEADRPEGADGDLDDATLVGLARRLSRRRIDTGAGTDPTGDATIDHAGTGDQS